METEAKQAKQFWPSQVDYNGTMKSSKQISGLPHIYYKKHYYSKAQ